MSRRSLRSERLRAIHLRQQQRRIRTVPLSDALRRMPRKGSPVREHGVVRPLLPVSTESLPAARASHIASHTSRLTPHTSRPTPRASHLAPRARCLMPCASCLVPHALCLMPCALCLVPCALCLVPCALCLVPRRSKRPSGPHVCSHGVERAASVAGETVEVPAWRIRSPPFGQSLVTAAIPLG